MIRFFLLAWALIGSFWVANSAEAQTGSRELAFSSTSYDNGFVEILIASTGDVNVTWTLDPFRKPKPAKQPWKRRVGLSLKKTKQIFQTLDASGFAKMKNGRDQRPDEPSVTIKESRDGKELHAITYPAGELPKELSELLSQLDAIYQKADSDR